MSLSVVFEIFLLAPRRVYVVEPHVAGDGMKQKETNVQLFYHVLIARIFQ